ncbi:class I SAM-dependent methyltransferase [Aquimarina sp. 2201CG14-23]|uniref:class I SAM-dependent methyltransferase n=1 Tax=Aquimarina mycalae TaxID=3040073 RepID=UPI00247814B7|nr:class I SAM-dependent methyltransferase [Aquimarina sp. 2201CG14-23]MDH7447239.1 class I SAM-dependent methyltransferase [Aquimarina sp. 2201CG14-23]
MNEQLKIYWELYEKYYTNDDLLKNFRNLMDVYHPQKKGKIVDIGCGQSPYLIDFCKNSNHQLFAIDDEPIQIDALKRRIEKIKSKNEITFYTERFPNSELELSKLIFTGVIVSNLLHFLDLKEAKEFITEIEKNIGSGSILLFTNHSWKHSLNGDFSYFKHFFKEEDFYELLPKKTYDYLYIDIKSALYSSKEILLMKEWIKQVANKNNIFDNAEIDKMQQEYLENSNKEENMTVIVRRK